LARYKGLTRQHAECDLRAFLDWALDHDLHPLEVRRPHIELYLNWMQEVRRY
jgi:integrase/recombinase XerD